MISDTPTSRVQRVRHELKRRNVEVVRVESISPHFKRITFGGEALADFVSLSFDDHIKFMLDGDGDGPGAEPVRRDYTPRHHDAAARELTLEFALHGEGSAAQWAAQATVGQRAVIGGPRGSFIIPLDCDWHLLVGDETTLPAIHRRHGPLAPDAAGGEGDGPPRDAGRRLLEARRHGAPRKPGGLSVGPAPDRPAPAYSGLGLAVPICTAWPDAFSSAS